MLSRTNFVLIDFQNVQPQDIGLLKNGAFKVKVFTGSQQVKIPLVLATTLQSMGGDAEYIVLETAGSNALDFHIAYYVGVLSAQEPGAFFHIISKDSGFDPLIGYLKKKNVLAKRSECIAEMPCFAPPAPTALAPLDEQIERVIALLRGYSYTNNKPRTTTALLNVINSLFRKELSEQQVVAILSALRKRGVVNLEGSKVSYSIPTPP